MKERTRRTQRSVESLLSVKQVFKSGVTPSPLSLFASCLPNLTLTELARFSMLYFLFPGFLSQHTPARFSLFTSMFTSFLYLTRISLEHTVTHVSTTSSQNLVFTHPAVSVLQSSLHTCYIFVFTVTIKIPEKGGWEKFLKKRSNLKLRCHQLEWEPFPLKNPVLARALEDCCDDNLTHISFSETTLQFTESALAFVLGGEKIPGR